MKKLFLILFSVALSGCNTTPVKKLQGFVQSDAKTAQTIAENNKRMAAAACYAAIESAITASEAPSINCGLLCMNEITANAEVQYNAAKSACVGTLILP